MKSLHYAVSFAAFVLLTSWVTAPKALARDEPAAVTNFRLLSFGEMQDMAFEGQLDYLAQTYDLIEARPDRVRKITNDVVSPLLQAIAIRWGGVRGGSVLTLVVRNDLQPTGSEVQPWQAPMYAIALKDQALVAEVARRNLPRGIRLDGGASMADAFDEILYQLVKEAKSGKDRASACDALVGVYESGSRSTFEREVCANVSGVSSPRYRMEAQANELAVQRGKVLQQQEIAKAQALAQRCAAVGVSNVQVTAQRRQYENELLGYGSVSVKLLDSNREQYINEYAKRWMANTEWQTMVRGAQITPVLTPLTYQRVVGGQCG